MLIFAKVCSPAGLTLASLVYQVLAEMPQTAKSDARLIWGPLLPNEFEEL